VHGARRDAEALFKAAVTAAGAKPQHTRNGTNPKIPETAVETAKSPSIAPFLAPVAWPKHRTGTAAVERVADVALSL
jgi:hypothetical protein